MSIRDILGCAPVVPVITITRLADAVPLAEALVSGGLRVLELTLRTPVALAAVEQVCKAVPEAIVGVGTLTRPPDFAAAKQAGARFGVTPGLTGELAEAAAGVALPLLPGIMTPSELMAVRACGFTASKLFPAQQAGGIGMLKALAGPFPDHVFCPTGGITPQNAPEFLSQPNVLCVGGSWLAPQSLLEKQDWPAIRALAREAAALVRGRTA